MKKHNFIYIFLCTLIFTSCDKCKKIKAEIDEKKVEKQFNYTIILDLSDRIIGKDQINRDTLLIAKIIENFEEDFENGRLQIAIAPQKDAVITEEDRKNFETSMFIDESESIEDYTTKKSKLLETLKEVYSKAKFSDNPNDYKGADIFQTFDDLRFDERNKNEINHIFVLTDGYQFVSGSQAGLKDWKALNKDLRNTKIMILETAPETAGGSDEFKRIQKAWYHWLNQAHCENIFIEKNLRRNDIENEIQKFIEGKIKSNPNEFEDVNINDSPGQVYRKPIETKSISNVPGKSVPCNPQVVSDYYKEDIQRLINMKESIITRLVLLKKENKQINLSNFQSRLKQGEFRNRNVYHVGVNPNCEIISIEIE